VQGGGRLGGWRRACRVYHSRSWHQFASLSSLEQLSFEFQSLRNTDFRSLEEVPSIPKCIFACSTLRTHHQDAISCPRFRCHSAGGLVLLPLVGPHDLEDVFGTERIGLSTCFGADSGEHMVVVVVVAVAVVVVVAVAVVAVGGGVVVAAPFDVEVAVEGVAVDVVAVAVVVRESCRHGLRARHGGLGQASCEYWRLLGAGCSRDWLFVLLLMLLLLLLLLMLPWWAAPLLLMLVLALMLMWRLLMLRGGLRPVGSVSRCCGVRGLRPELGRWHHRSRVGVQQH